MGLVTLTFDLLTLKLACESHVRWGTFLPNLGTLGFWVLELFAMYATDGQTDGQTDGRTDGQTKATLIAHYIRGRGHNNNIAS